jgi:hypothetical protein
MDIERSLSLATVAREKHLKSMLPKRRGQHPSQRQVVVDDQNTLSIDICDPLAASVFAGVGFGHGIDEYVMQEANQPRRGIPFSPTPGTAEGGI